MNRGYHRWHSPRLGRVMELLVFGHGGTPLLVFPTSLGRFFEYEDRGMIGALAEKLGDGSLQTFCVDSVDSESWYNRGIHPHHRVVRHIACERYVLDEVLPLIRLKNSSSQLAVTGCSFGGYHAINFALRHPDLVTHCVTMGGAFDIHQFLGSYYNDKCYFNCPPDYLPNMSDPWYLDRYRVIWLVLATGENEVCLGDNRRLSGMFDAKQVPHWLDVWADVTGHDWPWWQRMAHKYFIWKGERS